MTYKWLVLFNTPTSGAITLKETVESIQWQHAKLMLESKYPGIRILNYTPVK